MHSRNDPFDDAWNCHVDVINHSLWILFCLLFSCWTRAMQNHNAKVGLSSLKSILQRLPFPWFFHFSSYGSPVHHVCELLLVLHTFTDYWSDRRGRTVPHGFSVCFARQEACTHLEMSVRVHAIKNCVKNWLNTEFCLLYHKSETSLLSYSASCQSKPFWLSLFWVHSGLSRSRKEKNNPHLLGFTEESISALFFQYKYLNIHKARYTPFLSVDMEMHYLNLNPLDWRLTVGLF